MLANTVITANHINNINNINNAWLSLCLKQ